MQGHCRIEENATRLFRPRDHQEGSRQPVFFRHLVEDHASFPGGRHRTQEFMAHVSRHAWWCRFPIPLPRSPNMDNTFMFVCARHWPVFQFAGEAARAICRWPSISFVSLRPAITRRGDPFYVEHRHGLAWSSQRALVSKLPLRVIRPNPERELMTVSENTAALDKYHFAHQSRFLRSALDRQTREVVSRNERIHIFFAAQLQTPVCVRPLRASSNVLARHESQELRREYALLCDEAKSLLGKTMPVARVIAER